MSAHRYWRLALLACASNAYSMAECQFRSTPGAALLFSGGTATAAQTWTTYVPTYAADNNLGTVWSSNDNAAGQWWEYDYGAGSSIDVAEVSITARNDNQYGQTPSSFSLQYSDDNATWVTLGTFSGISWSAGATQVFTIGVTAMRVTQVGAEVWVAGVSPPMRLTQLGAEVWVNIAQPYTPPASGGAAPLVIIMA